MTSIDPIPEPSERDSPMASPFLENNPNLEMVKQGLDSAEDDIRNEEQVGEVDGLEEGNLDVAFDDINRAEEFAGDEGPEVEAIHLDRGKDH